jgi:HAD superfamily hydrolase (TIGR01509 family)
MPIKALIFDFDDTLVESERLNERLLEDFLSREYGVLLSQEEREMQYQFTWKDAFTYLGSKHGIKEPWDVLWERFFVEKRKYLAGHRLRVARGCREILSLPLPKAIVSGSSRDEIALMLGSTDIARDIFKVIVSADDCSRAKPDPEGFTMALAALGVGASETLVLEDSPVGIKASRSAGTPVAFVREFARHDLCSEADVCFETMAEALPWVRERMAGPAGEGRRG